MLIPVLFDQVRSASRSRRPRRENALPAQAGLAFDVPAGVRFQLYRALRAMARGQLMIVQHRLPVLPVDAESREKCRVFLRSLRDVANWKEPRDLEAIFVPGTAFAGIAGPILLKSGWCAPSEQPHYIPNLRTFFLTERGFAMLEKASAWWSGLGFGERLRLMLTE